MAKVSIQLNNPTDFLTANINGRNYTYPMNIFLDGKIYHYLGAGNYNIAYLSADQKEVYKEQFSEEDETDLPERAVRVWNEVNPTMPARKVNERLGWIAPYVSGTPASNLEISNALIDIYMRTGRIVVDAFVTNNFKKMDDGTVVCIDIGAALQLETRLEKEQEQSMESLAFWHEKEMEIIYNQRFPKEALKHPQIVNTIRALLYLKMYRPDEKDLNFLKTNHHFINTLANAYTKKLKPEKILGFDAFFTTNTDIQINPNIVLNKICEIFEFDASDLTEDDINKIKNFIRSDDPAAVKECQDIALRQSCDAINDIKLKIKSIKDTLPHDKSAIVAGIEMTIQGIDTEISELIAQRKLLLKNIKKLKNELQSELNRKNKNSLTCFKIFGDMKNDEESYKRIMICLERLQEKRDLKIDNLVMHVNEEYILLREELEKNEKTFNSMPSEFLTKVQSAIDFLEEEKIRERKPDDAELAELKQRIIKKMNEYIKIAHGGYFGITGFFRNTQTTQKKIDDARDLIQNIKKSKSKQKIDDLLVLSKNQNNVIQKEAHKNDCISGFSRYNKYLSDCLEKVTGHHPTPYL